MSLSWTYATLGTALKSHVDGDTSSTAAGLGLAANLDICIKSGEERILTELPLVIFDSEDNLTLTLNTATVTKPTGFVTWRSANFTNAAGKKIQLDLRSLEYIEDYAPDATLTGTPKFIADYSSTQWKVAPVPSASFSGKALFVKRPNSLVTDTAGTWISANLGLLLFRACLSSSEKFIQADDRAPLWEADYKEALAAAAVEFRHLLRPGFQLAVEQTPKQER